MKHCSCICLKKKTINNHRLLLSCIFLVDAFGRAYKEQMVMAQPASNQQLTAHVLRPEFSTNVTEVGAVIFLRILSSRFFFARSGGPL